MNGTPTASAEQSVTTAGLPPFTENAAPASALPGHSSSGARNRVRPPLERDPHDAWLAGVSAAIARHLSWPVWPIRAGFVALTVLHFVGLVLYGVLWILIPERGESRETPGLAAAPGDDLRPAPARHTWRNIGPAISMLVLGLGVILLVEATGFGLRGPLFWPVLLASAGVALVWRQADMPADGYEDTDTPAWLMPLVGAQRWAAALRVTVGAALVGAALSIVAATQIGLDRLPAVLAIAALTLLGVGVVAAPWVHRTRQNMSRARQEKFLADARADMAAHLHDSVLQTLALIQRQSDDPKAVAGLARRQERELRNWLYGQPTEPSSLRRALEEAGAHVEDEHGLPVEVVCVGDAPLSEDLAALVQAAREAMTNAAKHSGAPGVDVYAEVEQDHANVFVRDRGCGFELSQVGHDRLGVRGSIIGRMERHGGRATIRSASGEGTEVRLEMGI